MYIADLHIHSRFSRATSRDLNAATLDFWARRKGIGLIGTGDFTHPAWREELRQMLVPVDEGVYRLQDSLVLPCDTACAAEAPRFVITGEISTIYKQDGKTRKVHHLILLPGIDEAEELSHRLEAIGNLHSDGRPILGLSSRDLAEITFDSCPDAVLIPAHIWTPHFSLLGAFSDYSTLEECYGDLAPYIHALETGLSSDPLMNRRLSMLDGYTLVSNSDAHSASKLGREANLLSGACHYPALKHALETGEHFEGTIEFYPEEGKYHLDGHRSCRCCMEPAQTVQAGGLCPVCGRKVTVGVLHRVEELADRADPCALPKPFESLIPLAEVLADCMGCSPASKKVDAAYEEMLRRLGPELHILRESSLEEIEAAGGPVVREAIRRLRTGEVIRKAGYDGEYGVISLFEPGETERLSGQTSLLELAGLSRAKAYSAAGVSKKRPAAAAQTEPSSQPLLNGEQLAAVTSEARCTAVIAGPGTGKTKTLVARIVHLIEEKGVSPSDITAVTFTRLAAREMMERLTAQLGKKAVRGLKAGTFHSIAMGLIDPKPIVTRSQSLEIVSVLLQEHEAKLSPAECLRLLSLYKNQLCRRTEATSALPPWLPEAYQQRLNVLGLRDLDDVLLDALKARHAFPHLLVDEFQDVNPVQLALLSRWSQKSRSLFVIGDPDQAIYGFRGSQADCFDAFLAEHPQTNLIRLCTNYRSTPQVVDAALRVIRSNPGMERSLQALRADGPVLRALEAPDSFSEAVWIAKEIARMAGGVDMLDAQRDEGRRAAVRSFSEIAVLCRTHRQLEQIEIALAHDSIPCVITGHDAFLSAPAVQGLLGFFQNLTDPSDGASLHTALRQLWRLPAELAQRAAVAMAAHRGCADGLAAELCDFPLLTPWVEAVRAFFGSKEKPRRQLEALAGLCGVQGDDVLRLLNAAVFSDTMAELLQTLRLCAEGDVRRVSGNGYASGAVQLMTLHGAKGLEFPVVFLSGVTEGVLPLSREGCSIEEERRLFFVGMTRAREELILTCGGTPSVFWSELPKSAERASIRPRNRIPKTEQLSFL